MKIASLSLDLDNKWSYLKTRGDASWVGFPSYLDLVVPRFLEVVGSLDLRMTVFVVGQDAAEERNRPVLRSIVAAGHEIGNHSFHHEPWLHLYSKAQMEEEVRRAEESIEEATGRRPVGFRGPGFSFSRNLLLTLNARGYMYDASTLPTFIGPLCRLYYLATAPINDKQRKERSKLFGSFRDGFRPISPYMWKVGQEGLLEIPVTTMPGARCPVHLSYLLYIYGYSPRAAELYFETFLKFCKLTSVAPSFLLHPLDFLDARDAPELAFFPAMQVPAAKKLLFTSRVLARLKADFELGTMASHAAQLISERRDWLSVHEPAF